MASPPKALCLPLLCLPLCLLAVCVVTASGDGPAGEHHRKPFENDGGFLPMLFRGVGGIIGRMSQYNLGELWANQTANMIMRDDVVQSKCYGELGCINYTDTWYHSVYRPINFFPLERHLIAVKFWVHTRSRPGRGRKLVAGDPASVATSGFDAQKDTKFIIHGFLDTGTDSWVQHMGERLLDAGDMNVIAVDWAFGALPMYQQALSNTQLVAMETAHLISWLQERYDLNVSRVHIIGHSLGAQTAGYVGARVAGLARISGLDPAEPSFQYMAPEVRLDHTDALLVDVIHSDVRHFITSGLGMVQPCGHLDFYPNGGREQPGCESYSETFNAFLTDSIDDFESELLACRHMRAVRFFTDSIIEGASCMFVGHECSSYDQFLKAECGECGDDNVHCASMGYHSDTYRHRDRVNVPLYLTTTAKVPYCLRHYRVSFTLADPDRKRREVKGHFVVSLYGPRGKLEKFRLPPEESTSVQHGTTVSYLKRTPVDLGPVTRVLVSWEEAGRGLAGLALPCLLWCPDRSLLLSHATLLDMDMPGSNAESVQRFCPSGSETFVRIKPKDGEVTLYSRQECSTAGLRRSAAPTKTATVPVSAPSDRPAATSGRNRRFKLNKHTIDGAGPRSGAVVQSEPQRGSNWIWSLLSNT